MLTLDDADLASPGGAGDPEAPASTSSTSTATPAAPDAPAPAPAGESGWGDSAAGAKVAAWAAGESSDWTPVHTGSPALRSLRPTTRFGD